MFPDRFPEHSAELERFGWWLDFDAAMVRAGRRRELEQQSQRPPADHIGWAACHG